MLDLDAHIGRLRTAYRDRRDAMLAGPAVRASCGEHVE